MKSFVATIILFLIIVVPITAQNRRRNTPTENRPAAGTKPNPPAANSNSGAANKVAAGTTMPDDPALNKTMVGEFVFIPAGEFMMGSKNPDDNASPVHKVRIGRNFEMGKFEVTQSQWKAIMGNNPSESKGPTKPVEKVSWEDVQKFIQVLNTKTTKYYYRLPTEAEWEYACRAGSTGEYSGELDAMGWYGNNSGSKKIDSDEVWRTDRNGSMMDLLNNGDQTHPVGQKKPNAWGLFDMHGNVWEWCQDWFGEYNNSYQVDPTGPENGSDRVERGGSFTDRPKRCASAFRATDSPKYSGPDIGFRLLRIAR